MIKTIAALSVVSAVNCFPLSSSFSKIASSFFTTQGSSSSEGAAGGFPSSSAKLEQYDDRHSKVEEEENNPHPHHHHHHSHHHHIHHSNRGGGSWHRRFESVREALSPAEVVLESGSEQGGKALLLSSSSSVSAIKYSCVGSASLTDVVVITSWPSIEGTKPVVLKCIDEPTGTMVTNKEVDLSSLLGNKELSDQQSSTTLHGMLFSEVKMAASSSNNDVIEANKRFYSLSASARVSIGSSSSSIAEKDDKEEDDVEENEGDKRQRHHRQRHHQRNWKDRKNREENDREDVTVKNELEETSTSDSHQTMSSSTRSLQASTTTTTATTTNSTGKERYTNPNCGQEGYPPCETLEEEQQDAVFQMMEGRVALIIATLGTVAIAYASQKYARED